MPVAALLIALAAALEAQQSQIGRPPLYSPVLPEAPKQQTSPIKLTSGPSWIDTSIRSVVANSYLNTLLPSGSVPTGWTGNVTAGNAGSTSQAYRDAVLLRVNWFRQMAGVPVPIAFSPTFNSADQQAALMMSANGLLNQTPPSNWLFFSASGADAAAHSNLCLTIPYLNDPGCVAQYMQDSGAINPDVGHRRWLLYPQTQTMGTGDVQPAYPQPFVNALWVIDSHFTDARPATRDNFVAWPPKGYVPYQIIPGRWSFSYPAADFTNATVTMQRGGGPVAVRRESPLPGFGENTVVWVPDNIDTNVTVRWPQPLADTPISVTVSRVLIAGVETTFTYTVTVFDPGGTLAIAGRITKAGIPFGGATLTLSGGPTATADTSGSYAFAPVQLGTYLLIPAQTGYAFSPSSRSVSASTAIADFSAVFCDYSGIGGNLMAAARAGTGSYSFSIAAGCPFTATSNSPWLTINPATASGNGPGTVTFSYATNHAAVRTGVLTISGRPVNITQPSAGQALIGPVSAGVYFNGKWTLDTNGSGGFDAPDKYFTLQIFGVGDQPVIGDWNGDGRAKVGISSAGFWALDYNGNAQWDGDITDRFYAFGGDPANIPVVGDWSGDGRTKIGYYAKGFWVLDYNGNGRWDGVAIDRFYAFGGVPGAIPIVGDWNGDGRAKVGYFAGGTWVLDYNGNGQWDGPSVDRATVFTSGPGEKPVIGDWTGSGTTKIGSWKNGFWLLDTNGSGVQEPSDQFFGWGGGFGEEPIVGDWTGDGKSKLGFFFQGFWALDLNGNGRWDGTGPGADGFVAFGGNPGEKPVPGKWR